MNNIYSVGDVMVSGVGDFFIIKEIGGGGIIKLKKLEKKYIVVVATMDMKTQFVPLSALLKNAKTQSAVLSDIKKKYKRYKQHADELFTAVDFIEDELINSGLMPKDYKEIDKVK